MILRNFIDVFLRQITKIKKVFSKPSKFHFSIDVNKFPNKLVPNQEDYTQEIKLPRQALNF